MTDMGRRAGPGDMKKEDYDVNEDGVVDEVIAHKTGHQNGGADEISVAGLSGELADDQPPKSHGMGGAKHAASLLALVNSKITDANLDDKGDPRTPDAHKASHQNGGSDEIDCTGLDGTGGAGLLVDGTSGRVLRACMVGILDGTNANTLKVRVISRWNGDAIASTDNVAKNATTGAFLYNTPGSELTILQTDLSGVVIAAWGNFRANKTNTSIRVSIRCGNNGIILQFLEHNSGADHDLTASITSSETTFEVFYITDA